MGGLLPESYRAVLSFDGRHRDRKGLLVATPCSTAVDHQQRGISIPRLVCSCLAYQRHERKKRSCRLCIVHAVDA